ncbi:glycosyltransferase family 4 protein [Chloroflexota bacterium]
MLLPLRYPNMEVRPQISISSYLTNFGHKVTWVISSEKTRSIQQFLFNDVYVHVIPYVQHLSESRVFAKIFNRMIHTLRRMRAIPRIFAEGEYNLILVRDDVFDGLIAAYLKRKHNVPFVFALSNPLEQEWEAYKIDSKKPKLLYWTIAKFNALIAVYVMKKADLILPTTQWFEEGLTRKGISKTKLMPYPSGVDMESFSDKEEKKIVREYKLSHSKVIIYIGTMDKARHLSLLIEAFAKIKKDNKKKVKLLMVGDGNYRENLEMLTKDLGIEDDVIFTGQVSQSEVPYFVAAADIGVSPVPPLSFYKVSSPIKVFEYMAMAKPIVANEEIFEHKEVLEQSGGGVLASFTSKAFANAINGLLNNLEKGAEMGRKGREWVVKNRSYEVLAHQVEARYLELIRSRLNMPVLKDRSAQATFFNKAEE